MRKTREKGSGGAAGIRFGAALQEAAHVGAPDIGAAAFEQMPFMRIDAEGRIDFRLHRVADVLQQRR